jgi:hypothetical protein
MLPHRDSAPSKTGQQQPRYSFSDPAVEGLSIPVYDSGGERSSLLKVGKCQLREKKTGLFGMVSVKMAEMSDVEVEMGSPSDRSASDQGSVDGGLPKVAELFKKIPQVLQWNNIEYFEIQGAKMTLHDPSGAAYTIQAGKLSPLPRGQFMLEDGVTLTHEGSGCRLTTGRVVWWPNLGVYAVPGAYSLRTPGHIQKARHTLLDTKLEPITNEREITHYEQLASAATFGSHTE